MDPRRVKPTGPEPTNKEGSPVRTDMRMPLMRRLFPACLPAHVVSEIQLRYETQLGDLHGSSQGAASSSADLLLFVAFMALLHGERGGEAGTVRFCLFGGTVNTLKLELES